MYSFIIISKRAEELSWIFLFVLELFPWLWNFKQTKTRERGVYLLSLGNYIKSICKYILSRVYFILKQEVSTRKELAN